MNEKNFNIWHDIEEDRIHPDDFVAVIEISKNSKNKYELDKSTGMLRLDRVLYTSTHYPANYGFIPRTYAGDDDPLDVLVLSSEEIQPLSLVRCFPIGVIRMIDGDKVDDKIVAVPRKDPNWNHYRDINELPEHFKDEIIHFYQVYKDLEHKKTSLLDTFSAETAINIVEQAMKDYNNFFMRKQSKNIEELLREYKEKEPERNSNECQYYIVYDRLMEEVRVSQLNLMDIAGSINFNTKEYAKKVIEEITEDALLDYFKNRGKINYDN